MVFETTYINFGPIPTWSGLFQVFGFGNFPSTSGVWKNPATDPPTTRSGAGGARRVDVGAPDYSARAGNGIGSREEGSQKRQNDIKHDEACFGRRFSKINLFEG
jgi:hypothetical protein